MLQSAFANTTKPLEFKYSNLNFKNSYKNPSMVNYNKPLSVSDTNSLDLGGVSTMTDYIEPVTNNTPTTTDSAGFSMPNADTISAGAAGVGALVGLADYLTRGRKQGKVDLKTAQFNLAQGQKRAALQDQRTTNLNRAMV